jgi:hypothetical protein
MSLKESVSQKLRVAEERDVAADEPVGPRREDERETTRTGDYKFAEQRIA